MRDVKSRSGSVRAERAAETRRRIEAAARALFAGRGYGATTLREIADEAGVAVQTVYAVYGSKASILGALRSGLRDDPEADAEYRAAVAEPDPSRALGRFARSIRLRWEKGHDIVTIHTEAASVDPAIRADLAALLATRRGGIAGLARSLAATTGGPGDIERTTAILDALTLPEVYAELVVGHGWTPDAYEAWLDATLRAALFGPPDREARG
jgi:AcrR family transcriptional regulator